MRLRHLKHRRLGAATSVAFLFWVALSAASWATINGSPHADVLRGTNHADVIRAGAGDDRIYARDGDDHVYDGKGNDRVHLGRGADRLEGAQGRDRVYGGSGQDVTDEAWYAELGAGNDRYLAGKSGCLEIRLGPGDDVSLGNRGWGGVYNCRVYGGTGRDRITWGGSDAPGTNVRTTLSGGPGADVLRGGYGEDTMRGGAGPDTLYPDEGNGFDLIYAGAGDDVIFMDPDRGAGSVVHCGRGVDVVHDAQPDETLLHCEVVDAP